MIIEIDTNIEVIVVSLTTWEAHHSPRAKLEGCGELPRSLMRQQWPKLRYQWKLWRCLWQQQLVESSINSASDWRGEYGDTCWPSSHTRLLDSGHMVYKLISVQNTGTCYPGQGGVSRWVVYTGLMGGYKRMNKIKFHHIWMWWNFILFIFLFFETLKRIKWKYSAKRLL